MRGEQHQSASSIGTKLFRPSRHETATQMIKAPSRHQLGFEFVTGFSLKTLLHPLPCNLYRVRARQLRKSGHALTVNVPRT
jgi:hypothetical protein